MKVFLSIVIFLIPIVSYGQIINGYAKVSEVSSNVISLSNVDETYGTFEAGKKVIIMQMQDNVIGANTSNNSSFGELSSINSAGLYEVIEVSIINESGGIPTSIELVGPPKNSYSTESNSSLQVITFPSMGTPNFSTTQSLNAKNWDGNIGGVLAFEVEGILTLNHGLSVQSKGFRGAAANGGSSAGCSGSSNFSVSSQEFYADKGEGIYKVTNSNFAAGRAKILTGGGGGNSHNAGGGGGGNASAGGVGGPGWPSCSPTAGGMGGISLDSYISSERIFLGGGGGSGEGNNGGPQNGGNGGGIILIKANEITSSGSSEITISSNGESITTSSGNDGNSGGGAGGSIVFEVNSWSISGSAPLKIESNGGNGGPALTANEHGGGGGGGMGTIIFSSETPSINVSIENEPGTGGLNCSTCSTADNGTGISMEGLISNSPGPLPVELIKFEAIPNPKEKAVHLLWITASETNNDYFSIEKTKDLDRYELVNTVIGQGTTNEKTEYKETDYQPFEGTSFYRLSQTDFDGNTNYFNPEKVNLNLDELCEIDMELYPNPNSGDVLYIKIPNLEDEQFQILVNDFLGKEFMVDFSIYNQGNFSIIAMELNKRLNPGSYLINIALKDRVLSQGFIVK